MSIISNFIKKQKENRFKTLVRKKNYKGAIKMLEDIYHYYRIDYFLLLNRGEQEAFVSGVLKGKCKYGTQTLAYLLTKHRDDKSQLEEISRLFLTIIVNDSDDETLTYLLQSDSLIPVEALFYRFSERLPVHFLLQIN